ncbi:hypothetical protein SUDANB176_02411 [Streptomyces sp. enrichment culture]
MPLTGTDAYAAAGDLPPLVERALAAARAHGFPYSCRPEQGRLLQVLAGGARGAVGETGAGCGAGPARLAPGVRRGYGCTGWSIPRRTRSRWRSRRIRPRAWGPAVPAVVWTVAAGTGLGRTSRYRPHHPSPATTPKEYAPCPLSSRP